MRGFHLDTRAGKQGIAPSGAPLQALSYGVKVGYWPCFRAPYIELAWGAKRHALWYGLSGYDEAARAGVVRGSAIECAIANPDMTVGT